MSNISERNISITPIDIPKIPLLWLGDTITVNEIINPIMGIIATNRVRPLNIINSI